MPAVDPLHTIAAATAMVIVSKVIKIWKVVETARKMMDGAPRFPAGVTPGKGAQAKNWEVPPSMHGTL